MAPVRRPTCSLGGNGAIYSTTGGGALGYGTVLELTGLVLPY